MHRVLGAALVLVGAATVMLAAECSAQTSALDVFATLTSRLAAQTPTTPLSDNGADLFGVGGGKSDFGTESFNLSAHTGRQGDFGHFGVKVTTPAGAVLLSYDLDINCVHIHGGNRGVARGIVTKVDPTRNLFGVEPGDTIILGIKDGGQPSAGPVDDLFTPHTDILPNLSCKDLFYIGEFDNVDQGNVLIKMD